MTCGELVDGVDPLERLADGTAAAGGLAHVDRPELHVETALAHARQVHVAALVALVEAPLRILEPGRRVGVGVDDDGRLVQPGGVVGRTAESDDRRERRQPVRACARPRPPHGQTEA